MHAWTDVLLGLDTSMPSIVRVRPPIYHSQPRLIAMIMNWPVLVLTSEYGMEHEDRTFGPPPAASSVRFTGLEGCACKIRAGTRPTVSIELSGTFYVLACMIVAALALELLLVGTGTL